MKESTKFVHLFRNEGTFVQKVAAGNSYTKALKENDQYRDSL